VKNAAGSEYRKVNLKLEVLFDDSAKTFCDLTLNAKSCTKTVAISTGAKILSEQLLVLQDDVVTQFGVVLPVPIFSESHKQTE